MGLEIIIVVMDAIIFVVVKMEMAMLVEVMMVKMKVEMIFG